MESNFHICKSKLIKVKIKKFFKIWYRKYSTDFIFKANNFDYKNQVIFRLSTQQQQQKNYLPGSN